MKIVDLFVVKFILLCYKSSIFAIPLYVRRHYGDEVLQLFRQLERLYKQKVKRTCDIQFLRTCLLYRLNPKQTNITLHKESKYRLRRYRTLKTDLLTSEIKDHKRSIRVIDKTITDVSNRLYRKVSFITCFRIKAFIRQTCINHQMSVGNVHERKLKNLPTLVNALSPSEDQNSYARIPFPWLPSYLPHSYTEPTLSAMMSRAFSPTCH